MKEHKQKSISIILYIYTLDMLVYKRFVVQNKFNVKQSHVKEFEHLWITRQSYLKQMPGFQSFHYMHNKEVAGEYISQTVWNNMEDFKAWLNSPEFEKNHKIKDREWVNKVTAMLESLPQTSIFEELDTIK